MIGFIDILYTQLWTTGNYSAIADLHTWQLTVIHALGFSVFSSRILATDLSQSHCKFKSHMKSFLHCLIPNLSFLLNHLRLPSPELDPILHNCLKWTLSDKSNDLFCLFRVCFVIRIIQYSTAFVVVSRPALIIGQSMKWQHNKLFSKLKYGLLQTDQENCLFSGPLLIHQLCW
jgi:hypothetical protein